MGATPIAGLTASRTFEAPRRPKRRLEQPEVGVPVWIRKRQGRELGASDVAGRPAQRGATRAGRVLHHVVGEQRTVTRRPWSSWSGRMRSSSTAQRRWPRASRPRSSRSSRTRVPFGSPPGGSMRPKGVLHLDLSPDHVGEVGQASHPKVGGHSRLEAEHTKRAEPEALACHQRHPGVEANGRSCQIAVGVVVVREQIRNDQGLGGVCNLGAGRLLARDGVVRHAHARLEPPPVAVGERHPEMCVVDISLSSIPLSAARIYVLRAHARRLRACPNLRGCGAPPTRDAQSPHVSPTWSGRDLLSRLS